MLKYLQNELKSVLRFEFFRPRYELTFLNHLEIHLIVHKTKHHIYLGDDQPYGLERWLAKLTSVTNIIQHHENIDQMGVKFLG